MNLSKTNSIFKNYLNLLFTRQDLHNPNRTKVNSVLLGVLFLVMIAVWFLGQQFLPIFLSKVSIINLTEDNLLLYASLSGFAIICVFLVIYQFWLKQYNRVESIVTPSASKLFKSIILGQLMIWLVLLILTSVLDINDTENQQLLENLMANMRFLSIVFCASIAPAIGEEFIFRRMLIGVIARGHWIGVLGSAVLFGVMHTSATFNIESTVYIAMGLILSLAYRYSRSFYVCVGMHFLNNFISVIAFELQRSGFVDIAPAQQAFIEHLDLLTTMIY